MRPRRTIEGPRRIRIEAGRAFMEQPAPRILSLEGIDVSPGALLGLAPGELRGCAPPVLLHNGNGTLAIEVADLAALGRIQPDLGAIQRLTERLRALCVYAFCRAAVRPGRTASARMFGPAYGIPEEAATGMAAGALAGWLVTRRNGPHEVLQIEQGWAMSPPSPSVVQVRFGDPAGSLFVGGAAAVRETRMLLL